jgi:(4S)-4-hydroxy-5-phosphonooxypentane-2,3-dione isomerase
MADAEIVIVADVWVKEQHLERVLELLREDVEYTHHNEPDVAPFALHRDVDDPLHFVMIEAFRNEEALVAHRASEFYKRLMAELPDLLERRSRTVLEPLGFGDPVRASIGQADGVA